MSAGELPGVSPDAFDEAVASAARESESAIVHYDKSGHSAHVVLGKGWHLEKECVEATAKATVEVRNCDRNSGKFDGDFAIFWHIRRIVWHI